MRRQRVTPADKSPLAHYLDTGRATADNVVERWVGKRYKSNGNLAFPLGVLNCAKLPKNDHNKTGGGSPTPHWRLLEFGTEKIAARPMALPAIAQNIEAATDEFVNQYAKALDRAVKTGAK